MLSYLAVEIFEISSGTIMQSLWILGTLLIAAAVVVLLSSRNSFRANRSLRVEYLEDTLVIMPLDTWSTITKKGLSVAVQMKSKIKVLHVDNGEDRKEFESLWERNVIAPLLEARKAVPELVFISSPGGAVVRPVVDYILGAERAYPNRQILIIVPELSPRFWWQKPLHNHRTRMMKLMLSWMGSQRILIVDVPWHL